MKIANFVNNIMLPHKFYEIIYISLRHQYLLIEIPSFMVYHFIEGVLKVQASMIGWNYHVIKRDTVCVDECQYSLRAKNEGNPFWSNLASFGSNLVPWASTIGNVNLQLVASFAISFCQGIILNYRSSSRLWLKEIITGVMSVILSI